jgi:hypothetical protein
MGFTIFALFFLVIGLAQDYQRDKGKNIKAKVLHAVCLTVLIVSYAGSFKILGMLIRDFDGARERFSTNVGPISGEIHWIIYLVHSALVMTIIILAYQMIRRLDKSRRLLVKLLPLAGLLEVFGFYRGWVTDGDDLGVNHGMVILIGLLFVGGITTLIFLVYNSRFMKEFFAFGQLEKMSHTKIVVVDGKEQKAQE